MTGKNPFLLIARIGVKEGTLVMTIKSHTHSVPTLFIEHT